MAQQSAGKRPLWTQPMFQYRADKIADWVQEAGATLPEEDFKPAFLSTFHMTWEYWIRERDWHLAFFANGGGA